jgi:glycosyltransferase involved in cell wall biosynthesis
MFPTPENILSGVFIKNQIDSIKKIASIQNDIYHIDINNGIKGYFKSIPELLNNLHKKYDIVHCHFGHTSSFIKLLKCKTPIITSYCGSDILGKTGKNDKLTLGSKLFARINIFLSRKDSWSIAKADNIANKLNKRSRISIIPNGVNIEMFKPISRNDAIIKLGLSSKKKYILFPSDPRRPIKNYKLLKKAIKLFEDYKSIEILHFKSKVQNYEVPLYMNCAHVVILTSFQEGSPNVIKEAMACNRPVIATKVGDVENLLKGVKNCSTVNFDENELFAEIQKLLVKYQFSNGRDRLIQLGLDEMSVAKKIVDIYKKVLGEK